METEIQNNDSALEFHKEALVLNRLEMGVSVLCSIVDMKLDLDRNVGQPFVIEKELLQDLPSASYTWTDIAKTSQISCCPCIEG